MAKVGILGPTKVMRVALQDAASVAGLLITTVGMVADRPEPKGQPGVPPAGDTYCPLNGGLDRKTDCRRRNGESSLGPRSGETSMGSNSARKSDPYTRGVRPLPAINRSRRLP